MGSFLFELQTHPERSHANRKLFSTARLQLALPGCLMVLLSLQVMVFFSSCNSVKYHAELLNYIDIPVTDIHAKQKQQRRTTAY